MVMAKVIELLNQFLYWCQYVAWQFIKQWGGWIIALIALFLIFKVNCNKSHVDVEKSKVIIDSFAAKKLEGTVIYWQDKYKEEHAVVEKMTASSKVHTKYTDSIAKLLDIKTKNLQAISVIRTKTDLSVPLETQPIFVKTASKDSFQIVSSIPFSYNDKWTQIRGEVFADRTLHKDHLEYQSTDSLTAIDYWKRDKVLGLRIGKLRGYVDYQNANPSNIITGAKKLDLNPPKTKWSIGPSINFGYSPNGPLSLKDFVITFGISIQRSVIKF
jgi:hypothetical protein